MTTVRRRQETVLMLDLCEVRVPTYKRPGLLRRALQSLISQSHSEWRAVVLDDSPTHEAARTVTDVGDPRIVYQANDRRMGAEGNIDQAFTKIAFFDGARWFCVLEDDNYLLPGFLEDNIRICRTNSVHLLLRNQLIEVGEQSTGRHHDSVLSTQYVQGRHPPEVIWAGAIFSTGISNGGLFWSVSSISDLEVGPVGISAVLQEYCRAVGVRDWVFVAMEPLAVWRGVEDESMRAPLASLGWVREARILQGIRQRAYDKIGTLGRLELLVDDGAIAVPVSKREQAVLRLCRPWLWGPSSLGVARRMNLRVKARALSMVGGFPIELRDWLAR